MASSTKRRTRYYARIRCWDNILKKQRDQYISLDTESSTVADIRLAKVNLVEPLIKSGGIKDVNECFEWLNKKGTSTQNGLLLRVVVDEWLESRRRNNIRENTIEINERALGHFMNHLGKKYPIGRIGIKDVRQFKETYMVVHGYSPTSINMYLRSVGCFLNWLVDNEYLAKRPKVTQLSINEPEVKYLNETEVSELMRLDLSPKGTYLKKDDCFVSDWEHYKRAFKLYLTTGCRKSEPFLGEIKGMWLYIPPNQSKNRRKRTIKLSSENLETLQEMRERRGNYKSVKICSDSYNKVLKKALKKIGASKELTLHSLRHTYACIRRLQTNGNMPLIRDELGHKDIGTTQRYTEIPLDMLEQDFPSYAKQAINGDVTGDYVTVKPSEMGVASR